MKKLLGILATITITGSGMAGIVGNMPAPGKINENNNLQNLIRVKRANDNKLERIQTATYTNLLKIKISHTTWVNIQFLHKNQSVSEFRNSIISILNGFEKSVASGTNYIVDSDMNIMFDTIVNHFDRINDVFNAKNDNSRGLLIITDRNGYWAYPWSSNWGGDYGAFVN